MGADPFQTSQVEQKSKTRVTAFPSNSFVEFLDQLLFPSPTSVTCLPPSLLPPAQTYIPYVNSLRPVTVRYE